MQGCEPCSSCQDTNYECDMRKIIIDQIWYMIMHITPEDGEKFNWENDIHTRCAYGMHCPELRHKDAALIALGHKLDSRLNAIVRCNDYMTDEVLYQLSCGFPTVYNQLYKRHQKVIQEQRGLAAFMVV